jgi:hypothetical protein
MPVLEAPRPRRQSLYIKNLTYISRLFMDESTIIRLEIRKNGPMLESVQGPVVTRGAGVRCTDFDFIALEGFYTC